MTYSAINFVRQATMFATNHHGANDQFSDDTESASQGGIYRWMAETQTDVSATQAS